MHIQEKELLIQPEFLQILQENNGDLESFFHTGSIDYLINRLSLIGRPMNNELDLKIQQAEKEAAISWVNLFMVYICNLQRFQWDWDYEEVGNVFIIEIPTEYIDNIPNKEEFVNLFSKFFRLKFIGVGSWDNKWTFNFTVKG